MATETNLTMHAGDTKTIDIAFTDGGTPVIITGASIAFAVAWRPGGPAILTKTVGAGIVITNAAGGLARVTLSPADTATLRGGYYYYEAECVEAGGTEWTGAYGTLTILPTSA